MSSENYVLQIMNEVSAALEQGATKIVLNAEAIRNALQESIELSNFIKEAAPVLNKYEALSLDSEDQVVLELISELLDELKTTADHVSDADKNLILDFQGLCDRISDVVDSDEDQADMYRSQYEEETSQSDLSSFRVEVDEYYDEDEEEVVEIPFESSSSRGSWLSKILGR